MLAPPPEGRTFPSEHHAKESATPVRFRKRYRQNARPLYVAHVADSGRVPAHTPSPVRTVMGGNSKGQRNWGTRDDGELAGRKDRAEQEVEEVNEVKEVKEGLVYLDLETRSRIEGELPREAG